MITRRLCSCVGVPKVCIVGAGPAGFYAAQHLIKKLKSVQVDIIEKLPVPFGLIRYGVAPDHPDVKNVINTFTKTAQQANVNFYGNITLGRDITLTQLRQCYHAVLLSYGAEKDKLLGIENENAENVIAARRFVGWYNGLPDDVNLKVDLSGHSAAVIGQGNVAMDVARMLLTSIDVLSKTDITEFALQTLADSKIKDVYLVGRRGPLQAAFTTKELREQIKMHGCCTQWRLKDFEGISEVVPHIQRPRKRLTELMLQSLNESQEVTAGSKKFIPIFFRSPLKFITDDSKKVINIEMACNRLVGDDIMNKSCVPTDEKEILDSNVAFRSIGYMSVCADSDIPFDSKKGSVVNRTGRVITQVNDSEETEWGLYVAGWLNTGPVGVILNTMSNAFQVAGNIVEDFATNGNKLKVAEHRGGFVDVKKILDSKNIQVVNWAGWEKIDKFEVAAGKLMGKPREKVCNVKRMLELAD